ncbi:ABC transporter ATP-binding protein/permease [Corynebacterium sp. 153RC1]|uniref:ATP-binding cassette domain-containing protein n=1 Tax=unclassified Corynebacterium TaxID=2624378 RepID=UPI00211D0BF6|nr:MULTISPECIES: ABC transporter ATP-binding protein [unclassified Corynebacterium]MCQ9370902.1 ABC transporter ATP-binding protein/permease [Corynebacterium sp. 35RC1]MCQ9353097.1 ABC transporter ATP-binding protein/permease [Corynebacterium sp. 209RC1]MCQ9355301.1 ABC transporter ATP-binding protein/permease [Corynebacterium sp. 1222RC1]MCQ9357588.1 ABC transporter ATP-binding protein/permease [Corynebacterium sp. 122RC1]MCQ9359198.1 ABC transporter ATP-binding protein/permease [Corynebacter
MSTHTNALPTPTPSTASWLAAETQGFRPALALSALARLLGLIAAIGMYCAGLLAVFQHNLVWVVVAVVLGLAKALLRYGEQFAGHWVAFKVLEQLRAKAFAGLLAQFDANRHHHEHPHSQSRSLSGDLVERLTKDIDRLEVFYAHTLVPATTALLTPFLAAGLVLAATGDTPAALIAFGSIAVVWASAILGVRRIFATNHEVAQLRGEISHRVTDAVFGHSEIINYRMQPKIRARISTVDGHIHAKQRTLATITAARNALLTLGLLGGPTLLWFIGLSGQQAALATAIVLVSGLHGAAMEQLTPSLAAAWASARRVQQLSTNPPAQEGKPWPTYPGELRLQGAGTASVSVPPAGHLLVRGPSGVGKTRLLRTIMQLDSAGQVSIDGIPVHEIAPHELREHIAYAPQKAVTFPDTVGFNLTLGAPVEQARIREVLDALELSEVAADLSAPMGTWSGGQLARLGIARAVLQEPEILLLDEPTAHLDPALAQAVRERLPELLPGVTLVEVTHSAADATLGGKELQVLQFPDTSDSPDTSEPFGTST